MRKLAFQLVLALTVSSTTAFADDYLVPPGLPGSPETRMRTLNEVQAAQPISSLPYVITNSGSYIVVKNLTGTNAADGIYIITDNVTVDLNGFCLNGVTGSLCGINIPSNQTSIAIRNGALRNWGLYGIYAAGAGNSSFSGLTCFSNGWGANCSGISVGRNNLLSDCAAAGNKSFGILADSGCTVRDCKAYNNQNRGISATDGSTITGCSSYGNGTDGIATYNGSTITRCMAYQNLGSGIFGQNCTIRDCAVYGNTGYGVDAEMCTVSGVSASANQSHGIYGIGSIITQCSAFRNTGDGICANNTLIQGNSCQQNGYGTADGAGIRALGANCRIESNLALYNDRGIQTSAGGSFIARNTAAGNTTNYAISGTQVIGPVSTQTGTITNQNPWTNFEF